MDQIDKDIAAYEKLQNGLEKESLNRWVVWRRPLSDSPSGRRLCIFANVCSE